VKIDYIETSSHWRGALAARALSRQAISAALAETGVNLKRGAEVAVHLVDDASIKTLNERWRGKDAATNVLSFPSVPADRIREARLLGDILIAFETMKSEAEEQGKSLADHFRHLIVHGFLHILGFDHVTPIEAEAMENFERRALARLGVRDPYLEQFPLAAFE
jgi:probable rRNA maturation factor